MRMPRSSPWIASTPRIACAGLAFPSATAPASMVRRSGWYQALPSIPASPAPESMLAYRWIGVISPAGSHPRGSPLAARCPACTCAAMSEGGEVSVSTPKPNCASLVAGTGGFRLAGSNGNVCASEGPFGSMTAAVEPVAEKRPRNGAGIPPKASHAVQVLDLDVHAPPARERDHGVGHRLEMVRDARVGEPAEVVVEELLRRRLPLLGQVQH